MMRISSSETTDAPGETVDIAIDTYLEKIATAVRDKKVPIVDLIAVQTEDPFRVLVATILSARTKDEVTAVSSGRLFEKAPKADDLRRLTIAELEKLIYPVGFYKNKARYLKKLPDALQAFDGKVPEEIDDLLTLPGVGRKTANLVRSVAFRKPAICVDTHVHRIMNIWGYVETTTPLQTEMALRKKLPEKHWLTVNSLLVSFGQSICRPVGPHCDDCPLNDDCPKRGVTPRKTPDRQKKAKGSGHLRFISWNVNGIRAIEKKGFRDIVLSLTPDILALQETKASPDQLSEKLKNIGGYRSYWNSAERKGYSGVAVYSRIEPLQVTCGIGIAEYDNEGRVLTLEYPTFYFINVYFPNSGQDLKRLDYRIAFNEALQNYLQGLAGKKDVVLCGDYNVAHKEIDLKNPKTNTANAGFTQQERDWMESFLQSGWLDTFRLFNQEGGHYSWWSYRFNARANNAGWRIDYFCVNEKAKERVVDAEILPDIMGSDHCPVTLTFQK